jgi:hypothetical protein
LFCPPDIHPGALHAKSVTRPRPAQFLATASSAASPAPASCSSSSSSSSPAVPPFELPVTFATASSLFKRGVASFQAAEKYFPLDGFVADYAAIQLDIAALYREMLPFYAHDLSTQCKLNKRQASLLEPLIPQLNPGTYRSTIGDLAHEVAGAYERLADLKILQARAERAPEKLKQLYAQITEHVTCAIRHCGIFVAPYDQPGTDYSG